MYSAAKIFSTVTTSTFFRDIQVIGQENVPLEGALLLYGNHNNQFIDPLLIVSQVPRKVSFIAAAKSMRRPIIGQIGRALGGIPVERPQDLARKGTGRLVQCRNDIVTGLGTQFQKECKVGDVIKIQEEEWQILEILSESEIRIKGENIDLANGSYKIQPRVDQSQMFESVWQALKQGKCIGIFPEGGSHDQTNLLPLKPGICIMALGAAQKYKTKVFLQPVGLNYFKGHKFRSKVIVEFGVPYEVSEQQVQLYAQDKRQAISDLLEEVKQRLKVVTVHAPTYSHLSALMLIRELYIPDKTRLSQKDNFELMKRFTNGFSMHKDHPEVKQAIMDVKMYNYKLKALGVQDYQVMRMHKSPLKDIYTILMNLFMTVVSLGFALPGYCMTFPIALLLDHLSEKERKKALAASKVKLQGKDVVASYKIIASLVVVPCSVLLYTCMFLSALKKWNLFPKHQLKLTLLFLFSWPMYTIVMIRSNDGLLRRARKLKTLIIFYLYESKYRKIKKNREQLQSEIRRMVEMWIAELIGPQGQRLVRVESNQSGKKQSDVDIQDIFESLQELGI